MVAPIPLRSDFDASELRVLATKSKDGPGSPVVGAGSDLRGGDTVRSGQNWRGWPSDHPRLGVALQARGPDGLLDGKAPGQPSKLNDAQRHAVARIIETGPIPVHGVVRWRLIDLAQWIFEEFRITIEHQ